ncbi:MAG TPA: DUF4245 domain-containing protein [Nocardioidaceae bacterium]|nr:DUF4245 domain-containing protein [Nocardioidaceae bacterium]
MAPTWCARRAGTYRILSRIDDVNQGVEISAFGTGLTPIESDEGVRRSVRRPLSSGVPLARQNGGVSSPEPDRADGDYAPRRKPFLQQSYGDMLRSLLLFVVVIALVYGCNSVLADDAETPVHTVEYASQLASAEELADYEVLAPHDLPEGWRATSVDVEQRKDEGKDLVAWHLGFLTPDDHYVGLEQTNGDLDPAVAGQIEPGGGTTIEMDGRSWQVSRSDSGDNALISREQGVTTVVNGSPGIEVLRQFAASLR